jgi:hypothetical protein
MNERHLDLGGDDDHFASVSFLRAFWFPLAGKTLSRVHAEGVHEGSKNSLGRSLVRQSRAGYWNPTRTPCARCPELRRELTGISEGMKRSAPHATNAGHYMPATAVECSPEGGETNGHCRQLLPREHRRQKPEFGFHFCGIGDGIRDFLAKEVAIPLSQPVDGDVERSF